MSLTTDRLTLEPLTAVDIPAFVADRQDAEAARCQSWSAGYSTDDAERLLAAQADGRLPSPGAWPQLALHETSAGDSTGALVGVVALHRLDDQPDTFEVGVTRIRAAVSRTDAPHRLE
ncbi:hypothetical protein AX769_10690 [Frondihabitans sp. PAMC 28766]|nr:hypothetical protein AX769_10690 [Frondihabitans sp. PAMC 28766]